MSNWNKSPAGVAYRKAYYAANREKSIAYSRQWRADNRQAYVSYNREYDKAHPIWKRAQKALYQNYRRCNQQSATPRWLSKADKIRIKDLYHNRPEGHEVDHIIPLNHPSVCGLHVPWNPQYLPANDNYKKNNKFDGTYANESWRQP